MTTEEKKEKIKTEQEIILEEREKNRERVFAKRDKYESQGFADKDFQTNVGKNIVKMWLPSSVFAQQAILSLGDKVVNEKFDSIEQEQILTEKFYRAVCQHLQINGQATSPEAIGELVDLQAYAWLYWLELLYPLSLWSDQRVRKVILNSSV